MKYWHYGHFVEDSSYNTIEEALSKENIIDVEVKRGGVIFTEGCDSWFSVKLTPAEVREFATYLNQMADKADDNR